MPCQPLFDAVPPLAGAPLGRIDYGSPSFIGQELPPDLHAVVLRMAEGLDHYVVTYQCEILLQGHAFGHGRWHRDARGSEQDRHRLLSYGGPPTEGEDRLLTPGTVWEYTGDYLHRSVPTAQDCHRLLIRVSQTNMRPRDRWRFFRTESS